MPRGHTFVVERYLPGLRAVDVEALTERLAAAAQALRDEGRNVAWLRSLALPGDETCLCTFHAPTFADVEEANRRAGASYERIVAAIEIVGVSMTRAGADEQTIRRAAGSQGDE